jgi:hypothetical protein
VRKFLIKVETWDTRDGLSERKTIFQREMTVGLMETSKVRSICTREVNKALKAHLGTKTIILGSYDGYRLDGDLSSSRSQGSLSGLNGVIMRRTGEYDC